MPTRSPFPGNPSPRNFDYQLLQLEQTDRPDGARSANWYRYIIANNITSITGCRPGSRREVEQYVSACIQRLNAKQRGQFQPGFSCAS